MPMAVFAYLYYHMYIAADQDEEDLLDDFMDMPAASKLRVFGKLGSMLAVDGLINSDLLQQVLGEAAAGLRGSECASDTSR